MHVKYQTSHLHVPEEIDGSFGQKTMRWKSLRNRKKKCLFYGVVKSRAGSNQRSICAPFGSADEKWAKREKNWEEFDLWSRDGCTWIVVVAVWNGTNKSKHIVGVDPVRMGNKFSKNFSFLVDLWPSAG